MIKMKVRFNFWKLSLFKTIFEDEWTCIYENANNFNFYE